MHYDDMMGPAEVKGSANELLALASVLTDPQKYADQMQALQDAATVAQTEADNNAKLRDEARVLANEAAEDRAASAEALTQAKVHRDNAEVQYAQAYKTLQEAKTLKAAADKAAALVAAQQQEMTAREVALSAREDRVVKLEAQLAEKQDALNAASMALDRRTESIRRAIGMGE